jgi:signal peptidase II
MQLTLSGASRLRVAMPLAMILLAADCTTKELATEYLDPGHAPRPAIGELVRFTLGYNDGAAMGIAAGMDARWVLVALSLVAFVVFVRGALFTPAHATLHRAAIGLLLGGTLGNMASRIASPLGVVDFIDVGIGSQRFWTFNVADVGITLGAALLLFALWRKHPAQRVEALSD